MKNDLLRARIVSSVLKKHFTNLTVDKVLEIAAQILHELDKLEEK